MFFVVGLMTAFISYILASVAEIGVLFFLIFFALIILNIELLSLFKGITGLNIFFLTLFETIIAGIFWQYKKRPLLKINYKSFLSEIKKAFLEDKSLIVLFIFWSVLIFYSIILASFSPVNEPDAQGYHVLRALFWSQDGFIHHFEVSDIRNHIMPINSELFYTWLISIFKKDTAVGLLQFFSYFALVFSSWKIMDIYEIETKRKLWAIFIFTSLAGVISQLSSTQTDLTTGALLSVSFYLVLKYKENKKLSDLFFSSLSMAIAFGVKSTGIIGSLPLLIFYVYLIRKDFIKYFGFLSLNFLIFSSYNYILNFINYGNPLGSYSALIGHSFWGGIKGIIANFIRYIFQFFDFSGFTFGFYVNKYLLSAQNSVVQFFTGDPHISENVALDFTNVGMVEQYIGFGILGFTVLLPCLIAAFFDKKLRIFAIIFWGQIIALSFSIAYMIYSIRFIVTFVCIALPVLSLSYLRKMSLAKFLIIAFCFFYMTYASLFLSQRPLLYLSREYKKIQNLEILQDKIRTLNFDFYKSFNEAYTLKTSVEPYCENNNNIGLILSSGYMIYSTKYMELTKNCKVDILNLAHMPEYNINDYDILVTQASSPQATNVFNKLDIENPMVPNKRAICRYRKITGYNELTLAEYTEMKQVYDASCYINEEYIREEGFKHEKDFEAKIPKHLEKRINETSPILRIWKKQ